MASAVLTAEEVKNRILDGGLADLIELKAERKGNSVYIPELKISITPNVHEVRENFVNIVFVLWSDEWETEMIGQCRSGKRHRISARHGSRNVRLLIYERT